MSTEIEPEAKSAPMRVGLFRGVPRPLLALGVIALAFVVVATVLALRAARTTPSSTSASNQQVRAVGGASSIPSLGFYRVDRAAPAFSLPSVTGTSTVSLANLRGRPIVLNFWYSTCPPCEKEASALATVAKATRGKVTFIGVDFEDRRSSAAAFTAAHHEDYPDGFDTSGRVATGLYDIEGTPTTFFISANGKRELGVALGALTTSALERDLSLVFHLKT